MAKKRKKEGTKANNYDKCPDLQDVVRFRAFRSNWMFSRAVDVRNTSSERSSASYPQLYSSFLVLEAEEPPLRSECPKHLFSNLFRKETAWVCDKMNELNVRYLMSAMVAFAWQIKSQVLTTFTGKGRQTAATKL